MPQQKIINKATLRNMQNLLNQPEQLKIYIEHNSYTEFAEENLLGTTIDLSDEIPILELTGKRGSNDTENAIKVYEYLGPLTRTQAADLRLWVTLTHSTFWDYCKQRWPVDGKQAKFVEEHWFVKKGGGLAALRRNAISRLWWAVYLTIAPWEQDTELNVFQSSDRYKYTRILLSQQENFQDILENSFGSNLRLRISLLDALGVYQSEVSNKDALTKDVTKKINLLLKHRQLDAMGVQGLRDLMESIVKESSKRLNKSK